MIPIRDMKYTMKQVAFQKEMKFKFENIMRVHMIPSFEAEDLVYFLFYDLSCNLELAPSLLTTQISYKFTKVKLFACLFTQEFTEGISCKQQQHKLLPLRPTKHRKNKRQKSLRSCFCLWKRFGSIAKNMTKSTEHPCLCHTLHSPPKISNLHSEKESLQL